MCVMLSCNSQLSSYLSIIMLTTLELYPVIYNVQKIIFSLRFSSTFISWTLVSHAWFWATVTSQNITWNCPMYACGLNKYKPHVNNLGFWCFFPLICIKPSAAHFSFVFTHSIDSVFFSSLGSTILSNKGLTLHLTGVNLFLYITSIFLSTSWSLEAVTRLFLCNHQIWEFDQFILAFSNSLMWLSLNESFEVNKLLLLMFSLQLLTS